jgi:uncharacterized RDD family membrane protein YckC
VLVDPEGVDDTEEQFAASMLARTAPEPDVNIESRQETITLGESALPLSTDEERPAWRDEVASRVHSYRARRRRRTPRENSMRLDFDTPGHHAHMAAGPDGAADAAVVSEVDVISLRRAALLERIAEQVARAAQPQIEEPWPEEPAASEAQPEPEPENDFVAPEPPPRESRILEFPRQLYFPPASELAEPMVDRLRILDVPEAVENSEPAPLADIALEAEQSQEEPAPPSFELPLQVAPFAVRVFAGLMDALIVAVSAALFAMTALKIGVELPHSKQALALVVMVPGLLWAVYQYLFLVHGGCTPGMQMAHLGVCTFDDEPAARAARRWRALGMVLSVAPLGLGLLWALADEDTLCWHDRISRTYSRSTE